MFDTKGNGNDNMGNAQDIVISVAMLVVMILIRWSYIENLKSEFWKYIAVEVDC